MAIELDLKLIGMRLEAVRLALTPLNQHKFADSIGATAQQYNNWAKGSAVPVHFMAHVALIYKLTLDWLYLGDASSLPFERKSELEKKLSELEKSKRFR